MTDAAPDALPDVGAVVYALKPQLRRYSAFALLAMLGLGLAAVSAIVWSLGVVEDGGDRLELAAIAGGLGIGGMVFAFRRMRRAQEALVMPLVARAIGLTYDKNAKAFLGGLPDRLLPRQAIKHAEDYVHGQLGAHAIQMAEVKVETGGKSSQTLFKGVVAQFRNTIAMPAFFLAPHEQTRPGMIFKAWIPTDGLYHLRDVTGPSGKTYGVWTSWTAREEPPALSAVVDILTSLETRLDMPMTLFTATSNGEEMHIALSHARDLFRIGGLFPDDTQLFSDVHAATRDLSVPLNLVRELVLAETAAAAKVSKG